MPRHLDESDLVFTTAIGTPVHPRNDYRAFQRILADAHLRRIRLHDLRHTAASVLLAQGHPRRHVAHRVGHERAANSALANRVMTVAHHAAHRARRKLTLFAQGPDRSPLTWGFVGAACRNRTDDLFITRSTHPVHRCPRRCVPAGQRPSRVRCRPRGCVGIQRLGLSNGSTTV